MYQDKCEEAQAEDGRVVALNEQLERAIQHMRGQQLRIQHLEEALDIAQKRLLEYFESPPKMAPSRY